jgi:integrase
MIELTEHRVRGKFAGWKKYVHGRLFHLGRDHHRAVATAKKLVVKAAQLRACGGVWSEAVVAECFALPEDQPSVETAPSGAPSLPSVTPQPQDRHDATVSTGGGSLTVHRAIDQFIEAEKVRVKAKMISIGHYKTRFDYMTHAKTGIVNRFLVSLTLADLKGWTAHFASRPVSERTKKPISASYATGTIKAIRSFIDWADAEGHYVAPRRWTDAFKGFSMKKLRTPRERKIATKPFRTLSLEELQIVWTGAGTYEAKVYVGIGLWAGYTQGEIATMLLDDIEEVGGELYIDRCRNKTGVRGRWWLPAEVAVNVRKWLTRTGKLNPSQNPDGLAFLTHCGQPLIHYGIDGNKERSDAVKCVWNRLRTWAKQYDLNLPSFKYLRKTFAQQVRDKLGVEYAEAFCAHSPDDVQTEHYSKPDLGKLEACMRGKLYPVWREMFKPVDLDALAARLKTEKERRKGDMGEAA